MANYSDVFGNLTPPAAVNNYAPGTAGLGSFISVLISIFMSIAGLVFLFMIVLGAFQWITSGGDKESINKARSRIVNAIIGIVLLSVSFLIARVVGDVTGIKIFSSQSAPAGNSAPVTP